MGVEPPLQREHRESVSLADIVLWIRLMRHWEPACSSDLDKEGTWGGPTWFLILGQS